MVLQVEPRQNSRTENSLGRELHRDIYLLGASTAALLPLFFTPSSSSSVPLPVSVRRLVPVPRFPLLQFPVSGFGNKCRSSSSAIVLAAMGGSALNLAHGPGSVHVASRQFCPSTVGVCGSVPTWSSSTILAFVLSFCCIVWRP